MGSGTLRTVRARYVVGCDGERSTVRELLHVRMNGLGALSPNYNVLFRAPALAAMHDMTLEIAPAMSAEAFASYLRKENERYERLLPELGIRAQ